MIKQFTCSNDSIEANCADGCDCGLGAGGGTGGGLTILVGIDIIDGGGIFERVTGCSEVADDSADEVVKRCSKRFEHSCRRDFFDSLESSYASLKQVIIDYWLRLYI